MGKKKSKRSGKKKSSGARTKAPKNDENVNPQQQQEPSETAAAAGSTEEVSVGKERIIPPLSLVSFDVFDGTTLLGVALSWNESMSCYNARIFGDGEKFAVGHFERETLRLLLVPPKGLEDGMARLWQVGVGDGDVEQDMQKVFEYFRDHGVDEYPFHWQSWALLAQSLDFICSEGETFATIDAKMGILCFERALRLLLLEEGGKHPSQYEEGLPFEYRLSNLNGRYQETSPLQERLLWIQSGLLNLYQMLGLDYDEERSPLPSLDQHQASLDRARAKTLLEQKIFEQAKQAAKEATSHDTYNWEGWKLRGLVLVSQDELHEHDTLDAYCCFENALEGLLQKSSSQDASGITTMEEEIAFVIDARKKLRRIVPKEAICMSRQILMLQDSPHFADSDETVLESDPRDFVELVNELWAQGADKATAMKAYHEWMERERKGPVLANPFH